MEEQNTVTPNQANTTTDTQTPMVGRTNRKIYSLTLLGSFAVLAIMISMVASGALALAASLPGSFNIQATTLSGSGFNLIPGQSPVNGQPVGVTVLNNASIVNQVITKTIPIGGGHNIVVTISAGNGSGGPATATNLVTDVFSQSADSATFTNLKLQNISGTPEGIQQTADTASLSNVSINSPFLSAGSITLPNLSLAININ